MENSYQKLGKDVPITGFSNSAVSLSGIITLPIVTKTLGVHDYGIWAQVGVTISLDVGFVGLGLPYALVRFLLAKTDRGEMQDEFHSVLCLVFRATVVASIILMAAAARIAGAFFNGGTVIVRIAALIILVSSLNAVFLSLVRVLLQMGRYALFMLGRNARLILTDCGGPQKEAHFAKVPCITLDDATGWPETVQDGWNTLGGSDSEQIIEAVRHFELKGGQRDVFGDGKAASKIVDILTSS